MLPQWICTREMNLLLLPGHPNILSLSNSCIDLRLFRETISHNNDPRSLYLAMFVIVGNGVGFNDYQGGNQTSLLHYQHSLLSHWSHHEGHHVMDKCISRRTFKTDPFKTKTTLETSFTSLITIISNSFIRLEVWIINQMTYMGIVLLIYYTLSSLDFILRLDT